LYSEMGQGTMARHPQVIGITQREISRDARMMPVSHNKTNNGIEARMHEEGVIGLIKP